MSIEDVLAAASAHPAWLLGYLSGLPIVALLLTRGAPARDSARGPWDWAASTVVYLVAVPGTISAVLIGYSLFFVRANLLQVDVLVYFLPVISMIATFAIIGRAVSFDRLPGFGRLWGLMLLIGLTFVVLLLLYRTRILVGFFSSFEALLVLGIALFLLFDYARRKAFGPDA